MRSDQPFQFNSSQGLARAPRAFPRARSPQAGKPGSAWIKVIPEFLYANSHFEIDRFTSEKSGSLVVDQLSRPITWGRRHGSNRIARLLH